MPGLLIINNISKDCEAEFRKIAELQIPPFLSISEASRLTRIDRKTLGKRLLHCLRHCEQVWHRAGRGIIRQVQQPIQQQ